MRASFKSWTGRENHFYFRAQNQDGLRSNALPVRPVQRALVVLEGGRQFAELRARATKLRATSFTTCLPLSGNFARDSGAPPCQKPTRVRHSDLKSTIKRFDERVSVTFR